MTLPAHWAIVAYSSPHAMPGYEGVAHHFERRTAKDGKVTWHSLPASVFAKDPEVARTELTAFLEAELAREAKRQANARAAGERIAAQSAARRDRVKGGGAI